MVASRLSSATLGEVVVVPATGGKLAGVFVMRVNAPFVRSIGPISAPVERSKLSATVNWYVHSSWFMSRFVGGPGSVPSNVASVGAFELNTIV